MMAWHIFEHQLRRKILIESIIIAFIKLFLKPKKTENSSFKKISSRELWKIYFFSTQKRSRKCFHDHGQILTNKSASGTWR